MFRSLPLAASVSAAALVLVAAPAQAGQLFHDRWHDAGSEVFDDFCGIDGVVHDWDVQGMSHAVGQGSAQLVHFMDNFHGWESFTNPDTGESYVHTFNDVVRDHTVTDNGDGTLTIVSMGAGNDQWYASNGSLSLSDVGTVRWAFLVDANGTPADPEDDVFLEDLGIVKPSTGTNDTDGRDFCEDFFIATS
jgi:hypothetical protein